ncbi:uncharacterized protein LOC127265718 [Andrographis paniculata]|uniref:uncharacterized protein LOC127265718 n=1 Tax=Andrographis paniculata TaxID=175694 RepID=UPI0021E71709|nr:uncharacterized protein LOC127265718 [Andrographis paniculata]
MGFRRGARVPTSDDEDETALLMTAQKNSYGEERKHQRKRKMLKLPDEDDEEKEIEVRKLTEENASKENRKEPESQSEGEDEQDEADAEAQPLGEVIRVSGKGRGRRSHYASFEYDGLQYELEDPVLLVPEDGNMKPYVAIIKDIIQNKKGDIMVTGQWFYRPEEAEKKGGGNWKPRDTRELFYSFHRDEVPAESVMHKCVVHFIPRNKQIPGRKQHPGFFVQKVYDTEQKKLFKLTDKDYEEDKQHELNILVEKTLSRLGGLPDLEPDPVVADHEDDIKNKRLSRKKNFPHLDVSKDEEVLDRPPSLKAETPGGVCAGATEYYTILSKLNLLTGETQRDKWLEKLLQSVQFICTPKQNNEEEKCENKNNGSNCKNEIHDKSADHGPCFKWPDAAVPAVVALEKAAHQMLLADYQKYNQKMRQLTFNLKGNTLLARRLLNQELESARILNMLPNELKSGLTAEELATREPEEARRVQMTDARCKRCMKKQVGLTDIIQTGHGDRYQLECVACGNSWYASRDDAATLTIEEPKSSIPVSTTPLTTAKFEDVKNLVNPGKPVKGPADALKIKTEAPMPAVETQRPFQKTEPKESPDTSKVE